MATQLANPSTDTLAADSPTYPTNVLEQLVAFQITPDLLNEWCTQLRLTIPVDATTNQYQLSSAHLNLFKNIQKHLALGKSIEDIQKLVAIPVDVPPADQPVKKAPIAAVPNKPTAVVTTPEPLKLSAYRDAQQPNTSLTDLLERTLKEKDDLQGRLMETEKLNSHLYNANNLYHRKVRQLTEQLDNSEQAENRQFKLMDDKSKLQAQLLESEKNVQQLRHQLDEVQQHNNQQRHQFESTIESLQRQVRYLQKELGNTADTVTGKLSTGGDVFVGSWTETATLLEVRYDNYGMELDAERVRSFQISMPPQQRIGAMAVLSTRYAYENNTSWHRQETLTLTPNGLDMLEGVLEMTFWLNDKPMAGALYKVVSQRQTQS